MATQNRRRNDFSLELSVFPLPGVVLFPRALMPLNIFEPCYLQMVADALEKSASIALCPRDPRDNPDEPLVVGYGRPEVVHRRADGTLVILLVGEGKALLGEKISESPYLTFQAEPVEEHSDVIEPNRFPLNRLRRLYASWLEESLPQSGANHSVSSANPEEAQRLLEGISMHLLRTPQAQQQVLEMNDVNERIDFLRQLLLEKN